MSLKKAYESYFNIGTSVNRWNMKSDKAKEELVKHYGCITPENEMKPMFLLDEQANLENPEKYHTNPAVRFDAAIPYLEFAKENGIALRGHTLVWHFQTPFWFFKEKYDKDMEAPWASKETMLARMESYIKSVLTFVQTEYPGVIYAWDVVNEAMEEEEEDCWRKKSGWYKTVGEEFVLHAFRFAKKYIADDVKLFYNDYNSFQPFKHSKICELILEPLLAEGLIDGMGMQGHLMLQYWNAAEFAAALHKYGSYGLEVQLTELDIHCNDPSEKGMTELATAYKELFEILVNAKKEGKANVTAVTFWGMKDDESWLTGFRQEKSYPLLFGENYELKDAYHAVVKVAEEA